VLIRPLGPTDLDLFRDLRLRALLSDPDAFGGTHAGESQRTSDGWARFLATASGPGQIVVAALDGTSALGMGGAFITAEAGLGMVWGMYVDPQARGAGVADLLIDALEAFLRGCGATRVSARVSEGNARAIAFYRRRGYAIGAPDQPLREGSPIRTHAIGKAFT
jgi:ribosomal protein S18 acetylase RimI-like enzyme